MFVNPNVRIKEILSLSVANGPVALASATNLDSGTFVAAKGNCRFVGIGVVTTLTDTKILTVQLLQATSAAGAGKKALGDAVTSTASGSVSVEAIAEADERQLDTVNSFYFVGVRISHTNGSSRDCCSLVGVVPERKPVS